MKAPKLSPHRNNTQAFHAHYLGRLPNGIRVTRWPVTIQCGEAAAFTQDHEDMVNTTVSVIAPTAQAAADWVAQRLAHLACIQLEVWGRAGGLATHRWWGWDRAIFNQLLNREENRQLRLI